MKKVCVLLADGFEEIEGLTVVDLLRRAKIYVDTISIMDDYIVHGAHGINVQTEDLFDEDALIIEGNQAKRVGLVNPQGETYLEVEFDAPLFGIWSPAKKSAPFVCIEPWYGRSDKEDFSKKLEEREWGNELEAGEVFEKSYQIHVK